MKWFFVLLVVGVAHADGPLDAIAQREPTIAQTRTAAVDRAGLDPARMRRAADRARKAGLVPEVTVRTLRSSASNQDVYVYAAPTTTNHLSVLDGEELLVEVRATWDLRRVVFDPSELRAAREEARIASERTDLELEVTRLYYERRRMQLDALQHPDDPDRALRLEELTAQLDALTGGWFANELARRDAGKNEGAK